MPSSRGFASQILLLALCWISIAIIPASCLGSDDRDDVISFVYPSFKDAGTRFLYPSYEDVSYSKLQYSELKYSWDAGVLDGAVHLTTDDVYQSPVHYPPDGKKPAGHVILSAGPGYIDSRTASFNTSFTMSVRRSPAATKHDDDGGLLLEVLPTVRDGSDRTIYFSLVRATTSGNTSVEIGCLEYYYDQGTRGVYVSIAPAPTPNMTTPVAKHTVWVDYNAVGHNLSVYVVDGGKPKPGQATLHAPLDISGVFGDGSTFYNYFGLFASKNRMLPSCQPVVYSWNLTMDRPPQPPPRPPRLPPVFTDDRRRRKRRFLAIVLSSVFAAVGAAVSFVVWCFYSGKVASWYRVLTMKLKLSRALRRLPGIPREFKFADVKKATRNFHESNRLGRGGFGAVYKGTMVTAINSDGEHGVQRRRRQRHRRYVEIAVKKFTRKEDHGYEDFLAEVAIINRLRHKNIVPLLGWCYENGELLLIYQYMPNGSLDQHLFRQHQHLRPTLRWQTRYHIISDVAAALHYVHDGYERAVLHRDIKPSNIMLDAGFNGRLGDFGLARVVGFDKNSLTELGVAGTWGFIAPEYPVSHKATRQTDVFAFGVLVLEVVTGKRSLGAADAEFPLLTDWVWWLHGEGRLIEAVDDELTATGEFNAADDATQLLEAVVDVGSAHISTGAGGELDASDATRLLLLGLACTNPNPWDRPSMAEVVQVIAKRIPPPDVPLGKPTFVWPPKEELPLLDDLELDDDFPEMSHDEEPDDHSNRETERRHGLALNIGSLSLEIMVSRPRQFRERSKIN